ncbi:MAG: chemotaxis protein [Epsilonproteobacteria bacterium]|nr:chemotaxis protein [Campylobacterota bacterium]
MTQEELDALMNGDLDEMDEEIDEHGSNEETEEKSIDEAEYGRVEPTKAWPPPPPNEDNKVVHQLDDVTKESEEKANEILEEVEKLGDAFMNTEENLNAIKEVVESNVELFEKLHTKFPTVETFAIQLEKNKEIIEKIEDSINAMMDGNDATMDIMDKMQFQDIHRQKIERVINVMRALSNYMNALFAGKVDDAKRVSSATHIHGDTTTEDVVNEDDIEALLAQFGNK